MPGIHNALTHRYAVDPEAEMVERTNVFPLAKYSDGSVRLAMPGLIAEPFNAFQRLRERGDRANIANPDELERASRESFDAASLAPIGGIAAGAAGAVPEGAVAANGIGARIKGLFGKGDPAPAYDDVYANIMREAHASEAADDAILAQLPHGSTPGAVTGQPFSARMYRGSHKTSSLYDNSVESNPPWASSSPREAHTYAMDGGTSSMEANVAPLDVRFKNPVVVNAQGRDWTKSTGGRWTDDIVNDVTANQPNVDGVVFKNIIENLDEPSTTARAIHRGTVYSPLTGKLLYANSPTGASVPLLQRLLGQRGGQAAAADTGAIAQEMTALQQRHAELFGQPYRTPQPAGGPTAESMAADVAELRSRIQSRDQANASQQGGQSVPAAGAPRLQVPPNPNIARRVAEREAIVDQVDANPYVQTRGPGGRFVKKTEEKRLVREYYHRGNKPLDESPWGRSPTQYQDVAKAQLDFEKAKQGIATSGAAVARQQQAARAGKGDAKELKRLQAELDRYRDMYNQLSKIIKPDGE